ncbi:DUF1573 domain-containing protein [Planctellipticum variicoloris]|uniref:DUF1573 domain-containing protein n=1 Tax=Planctellipticum variicoloris TaxID=3064265 RepID=UPI003013AF49|nr:DUF1573 domain-containing protein [Planctomycetaceae bacterium SH412]
MSLQTSWLARCLVVAWMAAPACVMAQQDPRWAEKMFEVDKLDFGVVATGAECKTQLKITNRYVETIQITGVATGCRCAQASTTVKDLASGQTGIIDVSMDTRNFSRKRDSVVTISVYEPSKGALATVRIPVSVYIRTDVVVEPGSVNFGTVDLGQSRELKLSVAYAGRPDWKILQVQNRNPNIEAVAKEIGRGGQRVDYELLVTLKPTASAGVIRETLTLVTDDANNPHVPIPVFAQVESDLTVTPSAINFGTVTAGQVKTQTVVIRAKKPISIEGFNQGKGDKALTVQMPSDARPVHLLPLKFTAPADAGDYQNDIQVIIEGRKEPITLRIQAKIVVPATPAEAPAAEASDAK